MRSGCCLCVIEVPSYFCGPLVRKRAHVTYNSILPFARKLYWAQAWNKEMLYIFFGNATVRASGRVGRCSAPFRFLSIPTVLFLPHPLSSSTFHPGVLLLHSGGLISHPCPTPASSLPTSTASRSPTRRPRPPPAPHAGVLLPTSTASRSSTPADSSPTQAAPLPPLWRPQPTGSAQRPRIQWPSSRPRRDLSKPLTLPCRRQPPQIRQHLLSFGRQRAGCLSWI